jgi:hypothetical protein
MVTINVPRRVFPSPRASTNICSSRSPTLCETFFRPVARQYQHHHGIITAAYAHGYMVVTWLASTHGRHVPLKQPGPDFLAQVAREIWAHQLASLRNFFEMPN